MKKIALLITGGTIGMNTENHHSSIPSSPVDYSKLAALLPSALQSTKIEQHLLCYKDSNSMASADWQLIINYISEHISDYDGFIITHGTDTMAYSATAVAYHFGLPTTVPIVFTGSCRTPDLPNTDAWRNLADAVIVACSNLQEVAIVFAGKALRACRSIKVAAANDEIFISPGTDILANLSKAVPQFSAKTYPKLPSWKPSILKFSDRLIFLQSLPGINQGALSALATNPDWSIALVQGLGNGNLTDELIAFAELAQERGKHVVILVATADETIYPPLTKAINAGVILARGYSLSALWVKLSWILGADEAKQDKLSYKQQRAVIQQWLDTNFIGERLV